MPIRDDFLTANEFARQAGISPSTVSKWLRSGKIKGRKSGGKWLIGSDQLHALGAPNTKTQPAGQPDKKTEDFQIKTDSNESYSIEEFSSMTYLTAFGVEKWLKEGRLTGYRDEHGKWRVDSTNLDRADVNRLIRK